MSLILCHIGNSLPKHLINCIKQTRKFFSGKIVLISDSEDFEKIKDYDIEISKPNFENEKYIICKNLPFSEYNGKHFWMYALVRFFFIEEYVTKYEMSDFVTFDNDVLIFSDLDDMIFKLSKLYQNVAITINNDDMIVPGFCFFKSFNNLINLNNDILTILETPTKYDINIYDYISEMKLISKVSKITSYIQSLPCHPNDENFEELGYIFDADFYGQLLGGSPECHGSAPSYLNKHCHVYDKLKNEPYEVYFDKKNGPKLIINKNMSYNIYNLHMWSKRLETFMSE